MARTISVLYIDAEDNHVEHCYPENREGQATAFAHKIIAEGARNVVMRCTYPDDANPAIIHTIWHTPLSPSPEAEIDNLRADLQCTREDLDAAQRAAQFAEVMESALKEWLLTIQRAEIRGEPVTASWFEAELRDLQAACAA